jgi:hypothetical protein
MKLFIVILILASTGLGWAQTIDLSKPMQTARMSVGMMGGGVAAAATCGGSNTYVGDVSAYSTDATMNGYALVQAFSTYKFTTPPSPATHTICAIEARMRYVSGAGSNVRVAVYEYGTGTINKTCEGSGQVAIGGSTFAWTGHAYPNLSGTCTISASTDFLIMVSADGTDAKMARGDSGSGRFSAVDYTGGFPASVDITGWSTITYGYNMRVGLQ